MALGDRESGAYTEPAAPPAGAAAVADESTRQAQRARFATETRRGQTPRFEPPIPAPDNPDGAAAFWSDQHTVSGLTNEDLWGYGVRYAGKPDGETARLSEWEKHRPSDWHRLGGAVQEARVASVTQNEPLPAKPKKIKSGLFIKS
jgi:hypothetical protein